VDETFAQTVHARSSYKQEEVVWGARFGDMFIPRADGRIAIDMRRLDKIEKAELPPPAVLERGAIVDPGNVG
jgi:inward rectifier potassium channel